MLRTHVSPFPLQKVTGDKTERNAPRSTLILYLLGDDETHYLGCLQLSVSAGCTLKIPGPRVRALYGVSVFVTGVIYLARVSGCQVSKEIYIGYESIDQTRAVLIKITINN